MFDTHKKDESKYNRNIYRPVQRKIIPIPKRDLYIRCIDDNHYRKLIRSQVRPFKMSTVVDVIDNVSKSTPMGDTIPHAVGKHRKLIPFTTITELEKRNHIRIMLELCERIAYCRNIKNHITESDLLAVFNHYDWTCPDTGTRHTQLTPLTIDFLVPIYRGGAMKISNIRPVYRHGWLPGFYRWHTQPTQFERVA